MKTLSILTASLLALIPYKSVSANDWLFTGNGHTGNNPIIAGRWNNKKIVVCSSKTNNGSLSGHLVEGQTGCFIAWGNSHFHTTQYSVLQGSHNYKWVDRNTVNSNTKLVYVGRNKLSNKSNYVCRSNNGLPGRLEGGINGICYTSWGNGNAANSTFDVLIRQ